MEMSKENARNRILFYISDNIELVHINDGILRFEEHCHSAHTVVSVLLRGNAELTVEGEKRKISTGTVFFLLPYENHSIISEKAVDMVSLCIKKEAFSLDSEEYYRLVCSAVNGLWEAEGLPAPDIRNGIIEAASAIYGSYPEDTDDDLLVRCREEIEADPGNDDDIDCLADGSYMSKFHYIRRFRKIAGLTPNRFRIQNRIRKAQQMLRDGRPITEAALDVGFYDQSHFSKYFKRIVGVSPKEYISSLRNFLQ